MRFGCDCDEEHEGKATDAQVARKLFEARTIMICGEINQKLAKEFSEKLLALASVSDADIKLVINSQGGHVESGDTIHDMIRFVKPRVKILGTGWVASAGVLIYLAVPKEDRYSLPNTRFMIHQPAGGAGGSASDMEIEAKQIIQMRRRINEMISEATGQPLERVENDTNRNYWLSPNEAKEYGIVGKVIKTAAEY